MELKEYLKEIEKFLKEYLESSHCDSYVLGLSGGVDSTLVAAIAKNAVGKDKLFCYALNVDSAEEDIEDAKKIATELGVNLDIIDLSETYHKFLTDLKANNFLKLTKSNLKVRMRMCALFAYAQEHKGLVLGTDNMDERYVGYFTKYGDGAADVLPIVYLTKKEVREACRIYGVSDKFVERVPTAGLFEGQTDENEMGIKYADLDNYLLGGTIDPDIKNRIEYLHKISEHKRKDIPTPKEYKRN